MAWIDEQMYEAHKTMATMDSMTEKSLKEFMEAMYPPIHRRISNLSFRTVQAGRVTLWKPEPKQSTK